MQLQNQWKKFAKPLRIFIYIFPLLILLYGYNNGIYDRQKLFHNENIPSWLFILGIVSQILFTFRFIYQWLYSEKRKESHLPLGFWMISLSGSFLILVYAIFRKDPVLFAGQLTGFIVYFRNIVIIKKNK
jgi:lipid-A-disaccharide synthase-like uncharacterized protein